MAGRKGKKKKDILSKKAFKSVFCFDCGLCHKGSRLRFCYNKLYKRNPYYFEKYVFNNLRYEKVLLEMIKETSSCCFEDDYEFFVSVVCETGICKDCSGKDKGKVIRCYNKFMKQMLPDYSEIEVPKNPVPLSIISNNNDFEKEVIEILEKYKEGRQGKFVCKH